MHRHTKTSAAAQDVFADVDIATAAGFDFDINDFDIDELYRSLTPLTASTASTLPTVADKLTQQPFVAAAATSAVMPLQQDIFRNQDIFRTQVECILREARKEQREHMMKTFAGELDPNVSATVKKAVADVINAKIAVDVHDRI